jgi:hypothetical protein
MDVAEQAEQDERVDLARDAGEGGEPENQRERRNRELIELLNELRVALPGVQVLFAFLLTVPFSGRFEALSDTQRNVYFATFSATAVASIMLKAPTSYHRLRFRQGDKERMLHTANRLTIGGMAFLAAAIIGAVFLVADVVFDDQVALVAAAALGALLISTWFLLPLSRRARKRT